MARNNFFKNEREKLLWIRLNAERIQYSRKIINNEDLDIGKRGESFSLMQISENQLEYDEEKCDAPRFSFEELVLPHSELFRLAENRNKQKLVKVFGTELGELLNY